jgi:ATP-dependent Clp protease ATP-binding subunit ClpC
MFDRFTEKARRVIFFARYEAGNAGSWSIETEHLLLALLHENKNLRIRFLRGVSRQSIRKQMESRNLDTKSGATLKAANNGA